MRLALVCRTRALRPREGWGEAWGSTGCLDAAGRRREALFVVGPIRLAWTIGGSPPLADEGLFLMRRPGAEREKCGFSRCYCW